MSDFVAWLLLGAAIGLFRAWRKTASSYERASAEIRSAEHGYAAQRAGALGYIKGLRIVALSAGAAVGAVMGASVWGPASLLVWVVS